MSNTNTLHVIVWILNGETDCYSTPNAEGARTIADAYHRAGAVVYWQKLYGAPHAVVPPVALPRPPVLPIPADPHAEIDYRSLNPSDLDEFHIAEYKGSFYWGFWDERPTDHPWHIRRATWAEVCDHFEDDWHRTGADYAELLGPDLSPQR